MRLRPFSIILPDGKRSTAYPTLHAALYNARTFNASRAARDLPFVRVLNRDTGKLYDIGPDDNALDIEASYTGMEAKKCQADVLATRLGFNVTS